MSNFDYAIQFILQHEGGFQCMRGDSGNWTGAAIGSGELKGTNYGICAASYPNLDIRNLTREQAIEIYHRDFWRAAWDQLDKRVAAKVLDISVNCGQTLGPKILQRACGVDDDGIVGSATILAANHCDTDLLLTAMSLKLRDHYADIVRRKPEKKQFLAGWNRRADWQPSEVA